MTNLMTRQEAAKILHISVATVDRLRMSGQLTYIQRTPGGKVWITWDAIEEYVSRITRPAIPERQARATYRKRRRK